MSQNLGIKECPTGIEAMVLPATHIYSCIDTGLGIVTVQQAYSDLFQYHKKL